MFTKVFVLCATLVAASATALLHGAALVNTGKSVSSRHQDSFGNYAFGYDIVDGHASSKSRSEVGDGHGNKKGSYSSHINHVAPVAVAHAAPLAVAHAAPLAHAAPFAHAAPLAHAAPFAHAAPLAVAHAAPVAYSTSSVVKHVAPAPVVGHVAAAPLAVAHAAPLAYAAPVAALPVTGHGIVGAGHLAYAGGIAGHGLLAPHLGGVAYGGHY